MSSVSTTPKRLRDSTKQQILIPAVEIDKNAKYLLEFNGQKQQDQENLFKFLSDNNVKFDKKIPQRMYEAVVQLKNVSNNDLTGLSKESIVPTVPPEYSPEKLEKYRNLKKSKSKPKPLVKYNVFGEKIKEEGIIERLTKTPTTSERWKIKGFDQLQKNFEKQTEKKKFEKMLYNLPSSPDSAFNSHRDSQAIHSSLHKRTVSFKMNEDKNNYVTFNGNQKNEVYETFEQLQQSMHMKSQQKRISSSTTNQDQLETSILVKSSNNIKLQDQQNQQNVQQFLKSSLKLQKVVTHTNIQNSSQPILTKNNIELQQSKRVSHNGQESIIRKVEDSFCLENNIFNQKLQESFILLPEKQQQTTTPLSVINKTEHYYHSFSPLNVNGKIHTEVILSEEENENIRPSSTIPKKIVKHTQVDPNQSFILKTQKENEERQKNINKSISNVNLKNIKSKVYGFINSKSPKKPPAKTHRDQANIQELKTSFLENLRSTKNGAKPLPTSFDRGKGKLDASFNFSPLLKASDPGSDSRYDSVERSLKLSKILDPVSQKQFEVLQKYNENFKIKSGLHNHKYCLVGKEEQEMKKSKDSRNLNKSQILQKYADKERNELSKPSIFEWELNDDEMSDLENNEELTPKNFNKFAEKYNKWWFSLEDSQKMHYFSSEELLKYYRDVKSTTKKSLYVFLQAKKHKRMH